jgi:hypothetical protein
MFAPPMFMGTAHASEIDDETRGWNICATLIFATMTDIELQKEKGR